MSARSSTSGSGKTYDAFLLPHGDPPPGTTDRVGLVIDGPDGAGVFRLRLGALSAMAGEDGSGDRRILATDRAAAPDWLARLDMLKPVAPSPLILLIANLIDSLIEAGPDMEAEDAPAALQSILLLTRTAWERPTDPPASDGATGDPELRAATRMIEERLLDPALDAGDLMRALGLSRSSLYRAFQPVGGVNAWIRQRRLEHARDLLAHRVGPRPTVGEVAQICGFASDSHFSRAFRKAFGHSPGGRASDSGGP